MSEEAAEPEEPGVSRPEEPGVSQPEEPGVSQPEEPVEPEELQALVERVPPGWTEVGYAGRSWGLTRTDHARGGTTTLYAEELGGASAVSANVWHTSGGDVLRPCEMPAQVVLSFLRGWTPPPAPDAGD